MPNSLHVIWAQLRLIYGWKDEKRKGRSISLISTLLTSFYNVFITGIFYTGFLSMYEISLVGVGIITFISPLANCFSIFSPMVLERIQKRKWLLAGAKIYYYFMIIIATNLMPLLVTDPGQRVVWFCLLQFLATAVYAVFSAGFTPWFYHFYPQDPAQRVAYLSYNQVFSSILSSCILLLSGGLAVAVKSSGHQDALILGMRYFAFALVLLDVFFQVQAKEYPYPLLTSHVHLREVFRLSFAHPKYMRCLLVMFAWNYIGALNSGTWNYYLLNTVGFSYGMINLSSVFCIVMLLLFTPFWRKVLGRMGWIRTFGLCVLIWVPSEVYFFFLTPITKWMYLPGVLFQNFLSVGMNLSYSNIFYLNLPEKNATTHTCFQVVFCNLFSFLGMMTSTFWCSIFGEDTVVYFGKIPTTAVQYSTLARAVTMLILGIVLIRHWQALTPENETALLLNQKHKHVRGV